MGRARLPNYAIEGIEDAISLAMGIGRTVGELVERLLLAEQTAGVQAERDLLRALLTGRLLQAEVAELRALLVGVRWGQRDKEC